MCDDDYRYLGVHDASLKSSWPHCRSITQSADRHGYDGILLPSGYQLGIDSVAFAGGVAPLTEQIRLLVAVRCGELCVPQLARQLATLDQMLAGRLAVNVISSDVPGEIMDSEPRYRRTRETMLALRTLMNGQPVSLEGEFVNLNLPPPNARTVSGQSPLFYFGGLSEPARAVAAECADVYLMWPDTLPGVKALLDDMRTRAERFERTLRFGYRVHVIVRETERLAIDASRTLMSRLDEAEGARIRALSLDSKSTGVRAQGSLRERADDDGFAEENLWTGIGRARSGCGAAIVGDPDQVLRKLEQYMALGIEAFILSGYPHQDECDLFARYVLPRLDHAALR
ncbi:MAG: LLM class flavin-dependent oxidoreductase [Gammaproteobacteria bacterium]|nr:LLM class flavin-dependent oxidoreductase [Gammaproteobacteria bacterium]